MIMIKKLSIISLFLAVAAIVFFILRSDEKFFVKQPIERTVIKLINPGDTFDRIAKDMGLATDTVSAILEKSRGVYDLASIRSGKELAFVFSVLDNDLNKLVYQIDSEKELIIAESAEEADPSTGSGQVPTRRFWKIIGISDWRWLWRKLLLGRLILPPIFKKATLLRLFTKSAIAMINT